jgi:hypothetical protein
MRIRRILFVAAGLLFLTGGAASAQGAGKTGVTMGYPASIGIVWHISDKVAIRPELSISGGSAEASSSSFASENDSWSLGTGVSVLFYLHTYDHLKTYFTPRFTYNRITNKSTSSGITSTTSENTSSNTGGAGSFGAQYSLSDKFSVFGEVGFGVSRAKLTGSTPTKSTGTSWGTRTGVGVIFYP